MTNHAERYVGDSGEKIMWSDRANLVKAGTGIAGLSPAAILDQSFDFDFTQGNITLSPSEQLYTARGAQGVAGPIINTDIMLSDVSDTTKPLLIKTKGFGLKDVYYARRVLWSFNDRPNFGELVHLGFSSIPAVLQLAQLPMDGILYYNLLVSVKDPDDHKLIKQIAKELQDATDISPALLFEEKEST